MKLNPDYVLRTIAGESVLIPTGDASNDISGLISLNDVAVFIFEELQKNKTEEEITHDVLDEFEIDEDTAKKDVVGFIDAARQMGIVID